MPQDKVIAARILEAAVQLFSNEGFNGTATRDIARLADVHETSLFRYFPSKQELFGAAIQDRLERLRFGKQLQSKLAGDESPALVVALIIRFVVETAVYQPELIRLLRFGLLEFRPDTERMLRERVGPMMRGITGYLERATAHGKLRPLDPLMTAISFFAMALNHQGLHQLFTGVRVPYVNTDEVISAYTEFWLSLLLPANGSDPARLAALAPAAVAASPVSG